MKVESISIRNFKRFGELDVSFQNAALGEVSDRFLALGDNGSGKTTLLQAIALPLALATRRITSITEFDWPGFVPARYARKGKPHIELEVLFTEHELEVTHQLWWQWSEARSAAGEYSDPEPADNRRVRLVLDGDRCYAGSQRERAQFWGRFFAQKLLATDPSVRWHFQDLPGVFWFDQFRNLGSSPVVSNGVEPAGGSGEVSYDFGVARLRRYLHGWRLARESRHEPFQGRYLDALETLYQQVFPGRSFAGVEPMPGVDAPTAEDFYFLLSDGEREYDLVEMSAGEQAVFPILYEFIRHHIGYSVILVDEIDLNLHPPAAQTLVRNLTKLGSDCQFIFTTHSEAVSDIIGPEDTYRLPGGVLCL